MAKPIGKRNQYPFGINGIPVAAAVLSDGTKLTNIHIYDQRSNKLFDLMSADGKVIYQNVFLTGLDKDKKELDPSDNSSVLADKLAPGEFCIVVTDNTSAKTPVGFAIKLELNKILLQSGQVRYAGNYNFDNTIYVPVTSISVTPTTLSITKGSTSQLSFEILPSDSTNKTHYWTTDNPSVADVDSTGLVSAIGVGTTILTVVSSDKPSIRAECTVTVNPVLVDSVVVNPTAFTIAVGETATLVASVLPENADNKVVAWTVDDDTVGTVANGIVTALKTGTVVVTATSTDGSSKSASSTITVS